MGRLFKDITLNQINAQTYNYTLYNEQKGVKISTTNIKACRKQLEERITEVYKEMDSNPKFTRLKTLSGNMKLYLIEILFGGVLVYLLSFVISSNWSYLIQALPIYPFVIASIIILPINGFFSLEYERLFKTTIKKMDVIDLAIVLIKQERELLATLLNEKVISDEPISQNRITQLAMYAPDTLVNGPRNHSITFNNDLKLFVDDQDELHNLTGRLLIIRTKLDRIHFTNRLNLTITPDLIKKDQSTLQGEPKLVFLPKHRSFAMKLKTLANQLSKIQRIHINLHNRELSLIIEDYKLFEETRAYKEIANLMRATSKYFYGIFE